MALTIGSYSNQELLDASPFTPIFLDALAAFSASIHLLQFGLGWKIQLGLGRTNRNHPLNTWAKLGYPGDCAHLRIVNHILGEHVRDLCDWVQNDRSFVNNVLTNGGSDRLHLMSHSEGPAFKLPRGAKFSIAPAATVIGSDHFGEANSDRFIMEIDTYYGWYAQLSKVSNMLPSLAPVVDVYCRPAGWLGSFRCSESTGIWHCTTEEIHLMSTND